MCGHSGAARREVPEGERRYLDALVRGVYAKRDLAAGEVLTRDDVYFSVPLLKGQISTREFVGGEKLTQAIEAHRPVDVRGIDAPLKDDRKLVDLIVDRGLEPATPPQPRAKLAS
jgi:N-acetylneuraminate synthase